MGRIGCIPILPVITVIVTESLGVNEPLRLIYIGRDELEYRLGFRLQTRWLILYCAEHFHIALAWSQTLTPLFMCRTGIRIRFRT